MWMKHLGSHGAPQLDEIRALVGVEVGAVDDDAAARRQTAPRGRHAHLPVARLAAAHRILRRTRARQIPTATEHAYPRRSYDTQILRITTN